MLSATITKCKQITQTKNLVKVQNTKNKYWNNLGEHALYAAWKKHGYKS